MEPLAALIPGLAVLTVLAILLVVILQKLEPAQLVTAMDQKGFLVIAVLTLFCLVLALHLFEPQSWTADTLKVIVGVLVGLGATYASAKGRGQGEASGVGIQGSAIGGNAKIAGRDINETIERLEAEVNEIRDSVVHQHSSVEAVAREAAGPHDYLVNIVYERGNELLGTLPTVIGYWEAHGWRLHGITEAYAVIDGLVVVFYRLSEGRSADVRVVRGLPGAI